MKILEKYTGSEIKINFDKFRPHDQKVYISDISKAKELLGWKPKINPKDGITLMLKWIYKNRSELSK